MESIAPTGILRCPPIEFLDVERFAGQRYATSAQGEQAMKPGALGRNSVLCLSSQYPVMRYMARGIPSTDASSVLNA